MSTQPEEKPKEDRAVERAKRRVKPLRERTKQLDEKIDHLRHSPGLELGRKNPRPHPIVAEDDEARTGNPDAQHSGQ
jgi:hypothetical protein